MIKVNINGVEYDLKYSIRALFLWEQITGRSFEIKNTLDNYLFYYCMILASNKDKEPLDWNDFIEAADENPKILNPFVELLKSIEKKNSLVEPEIEEDGKKKEQV